MLGSVSRSHGDIGNAQPPLRVVRWAVGGWAAFCLLAARPLLADWLEAGSHLRDVAWLALLGRETPARILGHAGAAGLSLAAVVAWLGVGTALSRWLMPRGWLRPRGAIAVLLGFALTGLAVFSLALCGLVERLAVAVLAGVGLACADRSWLRGRLLAARSLRLPAPRWPVLLLVAPAGVAAVLALTPETNVDALSYHLAVPQQVIRARRFTALGATMQTHCPLTAEMNYLPALMVNVEAASRLFQIIPFLAALRLLAGWAVAAGDVSAGWITAGLLLSAAHVYSQFPIAKNDLAAAAFVAAGAVCLAKPSRTSWRLSAIFFGCAAATKHTGIVLLAAAAGWAALRFGPAKGLFWCALAMAPVVPWMAKSWLMMGDPLWPLLSAWVPGALWDPESSEAVKMMRGATLATDLVSAAPAFVRSLALGAPVLAAAAPLVLLAGRESRGSGAGWLAAYALAGGGLLYLAMPSQGVRFALPALLLWGAVTAVGIARARAGCTARCRTAGTWMAVGLSLLPVARFLARETRPAVQLPFLFGRMSAREYLHARLTTTAEAADALGRLPAVRRVLGAGEIRTYRMPGRFIGERCWGRSEAWVHSRESANVRDLAKRFKQLGCSHLLCNYVAECYPHPWVSAFVWTPRQIEIWKEFIRTRTEVAAVVEASDSANGGYYILRLLDEPAAVPASPWLPVLPGLQEVWWRVTAHPDAESAYRAARRLVRRLPESLQARNLLGTACAKTNRWEEAFAALSPGVEHRWIDTENYWVFAKAALRTGRLEAARIALEWSRRSYPELGSSIATLAAVLGRDAGAGERR
jgi:hypothetical protein